MYLAAPAPDEPSTRKRRWSSKVRTGCATCRARRLKCDESKPSCKRCVVSGRLCPGYLSSTSSWPRAPRVVPKIAPRSSAVSSPPSGFSGSAEVLDLFRMLPLINIGYTNVEYKMNRPNFLLSLSERMNPYIFDLPSRAGHSELLDSIVKCVSAALRWHSLSTEPRGPALPATLLQLYGNGVQMLRQALEDPLRSRDAEVLCATQLLCVFELLAHHQQPATIHHALGTTQLIKYRGAKSFTTSFDKALLVSHVPPILAECFFRGERCFLEADDWLACLGSCTLTDAATSPNQSEGSINMFRTIVPFSGLLCDCGAYVTGQAYDFEKQKNLLHRVNRIRNDLLMWCSRWGSSVFTPSRRNGSDLVQLPAGAEYIPGKQLEVYCAYEAYLMLCNRLYVALGGDHSRAVELQSLTIARDLLGEQNGNVRGVAHGVRGNAVQECLILSGVTMALATIVTANDWTCTAASAEAPQALGRRNVVPAEVFRGWVRLLGFAAAPSKERTWDI